MAGWVLGHVRRATRRGYPTGACTGQPPLALQLGGIVCLGATLAGALAVAAALWRQPVDRLRARLVRDATIFTGLDAMTIPLLGELARTGRPASIVVIEPDASHPLLDEARATGARVMIGHPALPTGAAAGHRRLARLRAAAAVRAARGRAPRTRPSWPRPRPILRRYRPDPERQPHLVARIDDPRHADHWRGAHIGTSSRWFEDALSAHESTASALADQLLRTGARQLLLCGDSTLALAILRELARRASGTAAELRPPGRGDRPNGHPRTAPAIRCDSVLLLDRRAADLRREYLGHLPAAARPGAAGGRHRSRGPWQDQLLALLDAMARGGGGRRPPWSSPTCSAEDSMHEAGRVARLHPGIPVFVLTSDGAGTSGAIFDLLQPFQRALLVDGEVPEDTWTRVARHWHECYRLQHPPAPE